MIDHIGLRTKNFANAKSFYQTVLKALDVETITEYSGRISFGKDGVPTFCIAETELPTSSI